MIFGAPEAQWHPWSIPSASIPCEEVKALLLQQFEEGLSYLEELKYGLHDHFVHMVANATSSQVLKSWPWWTFLGPVAPQMSSIFNAQAALCASSRCCQTWPLGEVLLSWQRAQEKMNLLLWLGTFHGSMVLAPDTVEGRFLQGQWHGEVDYEYEMSVGERMVHQFWLEYRAAEEIFHLCLRALHLALTALRDAGRTESAVASHGAFASSMVALYELAKIRTVDEGLLRWLSQGLFRGRSVAEFGALNGVSSAWLNSSGANIKAFAFDGVRDVAQLTQGRVQEKDLSLPLHLPRSYDWILSLEVAEHIPEAHLPHFLENIRRHCLEGAVISWSRCGTGGEHHVSCRSPEEARALFAAVGLVADLEASAEAQAASTVFWISRTVQVYRL